MLPMQQGMRTTTTLTRRSLLRTGAAATAATLVGIRPWAAASATASAPGAHLLRSSYTGLVGERFTMGSGHLRLLAVSDLAGAAGQPSLAGSQDAFALELSGPLDAPLEAGIHTLHHEQLGAFQLFASPVDRPQGDRRYEAVIDRSVGVPKSPPKPPAPAPAPAVTAPADPPDSHTAEPKRARLLRRVSLRRTPHGARAEIFLQPHVDAARVQVRLMRRGRTLAVADRDVHEQRAVLRFRDVPHLRAGTYALVVTVVDDAGLIATRRRRVRLA